MGCICGGVPMGRERTSARVYLKATRSVLVCSAKALAVVRERTEWRGVKGTETIGMDFWAAVEMNERSRRKREAAAVAAMVDGEPELWTFGS